VVTVVELLLALAVVDRMQVHMQVDTVRVDMVDHMPAHTQVDMRVEVMQVDTQVVDIIIHTLSVTLHPCVHRLYHTLCQCSNVQDPHTLTLPLLYMFNLLDPFTILIAKGTPCAPNLVQSHPNQSNL
jgi:hypothetical protein